MKFQDDEHNIVDYKDDLLLYFLQQYSDNEKKMESRSIFVDEHDNIVMKGLPYPDEYVESAFLKTDIKTSRHEIGHAIEGTAIMVFKHNGIWHTSTHKKIDSFKSYWADNTTTFGECFAAGIAQALYQDMKKTEAKEYLTKVYDTYLNPNWKYTFIQPPIYSERIGSKPDKHVFPVPVPVYVMDSSFQVIEDAANIPRLHKHLTYTQIECRNLSNQDILDDVKLADPDRYQGCYIRPRCGRGMTKIYSKVYNDRVLLRDGTASLRFRYIILRRLKDNQVRDFCKCYPELNWQDIEKEIYATCRDIDVMFHDNCTDKYDFSYLLRLMARDNEPVNTDTLAERSYRNPRIFNGIMKNRRRYLNKRPYIDPYANVVVPDDVKQKIAAFIKDQLNFEEEDVDDKTVKQSETK